LKNFGEGWGILPSGDALVMIDSHDLQRGHTGSFDTNINFFDSTLLKMSTAFMLAWPYGVTRVMSSYNWPRKIEVLFYKIHNCETHGVKQLTSLNGLKSKDFNLTSLDIKGNKDSKIRLRNNNLKSHPIDRIIDKYY
jgi:hypothetical protein